MSTKKTEKTRSIDVNQRALRLHEKCQGKYEIVSKVPLRRAEDLTLAYTPGVAAPCLEIEKHPETIYDYTTKGNMVAVVTNGTAVLGLGNIGAGAGLSTSAGLTYSGERFQRYFSDFAEQFGIRDMYTGGFYPFPDEETRWAWWARHIYYNRYVDVPKPVYKKLFELVKDTD